MTDKESAAIAAAAAGSPSSGEAPTAEASTTRHPDHPTAAPPCPASSAMAFALIPQLRKLVIDFEVCADRRHNAEGVVAWAARAWRFVVFRDPPVLYNFPLTWKWVDDFCQPLGVEEPPADL